MIRPAFKPGEKCRAHISRQFELDGSIGLLLNHGGTISDICASDNIADLQLHQVATAQFAIDGEIEKRSISQPSLAVEMKTDCSNLRLRERPFSPHVFTGIPRNPALHRRVKTRVVHRRSPGPSWPQ